MRDSAAAAATALPARTLPVIETMSTPSCRTSASPVSPLPSRTLKTPAGVCLAMISAIHSVEAGVFSDGLRMIELPAAIAGPNFQIAIMNG